MMSDIDNMLSKGRKVKAVTDDLILSIRVADSGESRVATTICMTIAEQFAATLYMVEGGFSSHSPILVRSMLEGLADLTNLVSDASYLDQLRHDNAHNDAALYKDYADDPGMQNDIEAIESIVARKDVAISIRDELRSAGFKKLSVIEKFKLADIMPSYVAYRVFCSFAHNQLSTLLARHTGDFNINYHVEAPKEMTVGILDIAVSILMHALATLPKATNLTEADLERLTDEINEIWSA